MTEYAVSEILVKRINAVEKTYGQVLEVLGLLRFSFAGVPGVQSILWETNGGPLVNTDEQNNSNEADQNPHPRVLSRNVRVNCLSGIIRRCRHEAAVRARDRSRTPILQCINGSSLNGIS